MGILVRGGASVPSGRCLLPRDARNSMRGLAGGHPASSRGAAFGGTLMRGSKFLIAPLFAALLALLAGSAGAEPLKLRVGWVLVPAEITPILFPDPTVARHFGKSYVIESLRFQGSSLYTQALAAGELDIAPFGYSSFALAVENAHLDDLRIILD